MLAIFSHTPAAKVQECWQRQLVAKMAASTSTRSLESKLRWILKEPSPIKYSSRESKWLYRQRSAHYPYSYTITYWWFSLIPGLSRPTICGMKSKRGELGMVLWVTSHAKPYQIGSPLPLSILQAMKHEELGTRLLMDLVIGASFPCYLGMRLL